MSSYGAAEHQPISGDSRTEIGAGSVAPTTGGGADTNASTHTIAGSENAGSGSSSDLESQPLLRDRLLSPDDPKVSPLNLYKIRVLRVIIKAMAGVNVVLMFLFLLSDFVSIPGLNSRGRSFLELDLTILCVLTNLLTLWCFVVPAYGERVVGYVAAGLVALDLLVVLSITYLRHQFGLIGNFLLGWTFFNLVLNGFADYWVEQGKRYQEIRYTGRPETRRSFAEMIVVIIKFVARVLIFLIVWNISLSLWLSAFDTHEKPWGKMVAVNNKQFKVHLACFGDVYSNGTQPIVLVEGGQRTSSEEFSEWIEEMHHLNQIERYCVWDRPGFGFSDSAPSPISVSIIVDYLIEALHKEGIEGPFTPVGFDVGGLYSKVFAARKSDVVESVVLVDSWHEDLLRLRPFSGSGRVDEASREFKGIIEFMTTWQGFKLWVRGVVSPLGIVTNIHWFLHPKKHSSKDRVYGSDMYYSTQYVRARLQEQTTASILSYNEVAGADIARIPLYVVSSDKMIQKAKNWGRWQREITKWSTQTEEWMIAEKAGHELWKGLARNKVQQLLARAVGATLSH